jgi:hypothetical protein
MTIYLSASLEIACVNSKTGCSFRKSIYFDIVIFREVGAQDILECGEREGIPAEAMPIVHNRVSKERFMEQNYRSNNSIWTAKWKFEYFYLSTRQ